MTVVEGRECGGAEDWPGWGGRGAAAVARCGTGVTRSGGAEGDAGEEAEAAGYEATRSGSLTDTVWASSLSSRPSATDAAPGRGTRSGGVESSSTKGRRRGRPQHPRSFATPHWPPSGPPPCSHYSAPQQRVGPAMPPLLLGAAAAGRAGSTAPAPRAAARAVVRELDLRLPTFGSGWRIRRRALRRDGSRRMRRRPLGRCAPRPAASAPARAARPREEARRRRAGFLGSPPAHGRGERERRGRRKVLRRLQRRGRRERGGGDMLDCRPHMS
ncbi:hypothetical protein PAHAL_6G056600 [Panicum hallii]|uniref:Uncharacterized protein n=1 Tax=Panicum hallii TaxID=206008 RepID=A0A2S3I0P3_9POAL|nr:hypothetical protein PAHAL_6G056600 [Panicum hallii]